MCILDTERKIKHLLLNEIRMHSFDDSIYNNCVLTPFLLPQKTSLVLIAGDYPTKNIKPDLLNSLAKFFPVK